MLCLWSILALYLPSDTIIMQIFLKNLVTQANLVLSSRLLLKASKETGWFTKSFSLPKALLRWKVKRNGKTSLSVTDGSLIGEWHMAWLLAALKAQNFWTSITDSAQNPTYKGLKQDPNCTFCSNSPESLIHLFWYCMNVETFWENLIERLKESKLVPRNYPKQITVFLGLRPDTSTFSLQLNFCFLLARYYIWCCKTSNKTPRLQSFIMVLKSQFYIESYKTRENSKKWQPLLPILTTN